LKVALNTINQTKPKLRIKDCEQQS
jgi:hypothetical protein